MSKIIRAENISFTYPGDEDTPPVPALRNVSFEIEEGSFTVILGHNGSGKSTLAKLLCMIEEPSGGKLEIMGRDMTSDDVTDEDIMKIRRDIGMVFQNPDNQIVATVVEEDVAFGCENLGIPPKEIRERVDKALSDVGMTEYARFHAANLSGGQKQRVAIAGVIAMERKCIIFDESTAMLDPVGRREVMAIIQRLNREKGMTIILITHYMNEASLADEIIVMDEGRTVAQGTPKEIFSNPGMLWEIDLDVPQSTELMYKLNRAGLDIPYGAYSEEECAKIISAYLNRGI